MTERSVYNKLDELFFLEIFKTIEKLKTADPISFIVQHNQGYLNPQLKTLLFSNLLDKSGSSWVCTFLDDLKALFKRLICNYDVLFVEFFEKFFAEYLKNYPHHFKADSISL